MGRREFNPLELTLNTVDDVVRLFIQSSVFPRRMICQRGQWLKIDLYCPQNIVLQLYYVAVAELLVFCQWEDIAITWCSS